MLDTSRQRRVPGRYCASALARAGAGACLIARPRPIVALAGAGQPDTVAVIGARALGARHLLEAAALYLRPVPSTQRLILGIELVHAASMFGLAAVSRQHRRLAVCAGASATVTAALSYITITEGQNGREH
jgi:hypothetical protein